MSSETWLWYVQKYRSHRKHLLAREAEAASWNQRRQLYGVAAIGGGGGKREVSPWPAVAPTMGFPPMTTMHHFRPLHVWGHPSMPIWPKHAPHSQPLPPQPLPWAPAAAPPPSQDPSLWHAQHQRVSSFNFRKKQPNPIEPIGILAKLLTGTFFCSEKETYNFLINYGIFFHKGRNL